MYQVVCHSARLQNRERASYNSYICVLVNVFIFFFFLRNFFYLIFFLSVQRAAEMGFETLILFFYFVTNGDTENTDTMLAQEIDLNNLVEP